MRDHRRPIPRVALRPAEAADAIGISKRQLDTFIHDGMLPICQYGRIVWILVKDLEAFVETFRVSGPARGDSE
jgi:hypothetical protein